MMSIKIQWAFWNQSLSNLREIDNKLKERNKSTKSQEKAINHQRIRQAASKCQNHKIKANKSTRKSSWWFLKWMRIKTARKNKSFWRNRNLPRSMLKSKLMDSFRTNKKILMKKLPRIVLQNRIIQILLLLILNNNQMILYKQHQSKVDQEWRSKDQLNAKRKVLKSSNKQRMKPNLSLRKWLHHKMYMRKSNKSTYHLIKYSKRHSEPVLVLSKKTILSKGRYRKTQIRSSNPLVLHLINSKTSINKWLGFPTYTKPDKTERWTNNANRTQLETTKGYTTTKTTWAITTITIITCITWCIIHQLTTKAKTAKQSIFSRNTTVKKKSSWSTVKRTPPSHLD